MVAAIELALIAPWRQPLWRRFCAWWFGRALHQPGLGKPGPAECRSHARRAAGPPDGLAR